MKTTERHGMKTAERLGDGTRRPCFVFLTDAGAVKVTDERGILSEAEAEAIAGTRSPRMK